jgi:hypothetical protein
MENPDMMSTLLDAINNINNNMNSLKTDMNKSNQAFNDNVKKLQAGNIAIREEVLARIAARSRALHTRQLAVTLTATFPVVTVPTVLKTPPLCFTVPGIESSPSHIDSTLSMTSISVLESPESLETVIRIPVRTTGSLYDITPVVESNHATEELPMDISPDMVTEELNNKESVIVCDFNHQLSVSTQQLGYPYPILIEDDPCGNKHGCFSAHSNATLYSVWGEVHIPMTVVLVS